MKKFMYKCGQVIADAYNLQTQETPISTSFLQSSRFMWAVYSTVFAFKTLALTCHYSLGNKRFAHIHHVIIRHIASCHDNTQITNEHKMNGCDQPVPLANCENRHWRFTPEQQIVRAQFRQLLKNSNTSQPIEYKSSISVKFQNYTAMNAPRQITITISPHEMHSYIKLHVDLSTMPTP